MTRQDYDKSLEEFRIASRKFRAIQQDYRSRIIGDDEFLKGKADFDKALEISDEAERLFVEDGNRQIYSFE